MLDVERQKDITRLTREWSSARLLNQAGVLHSRSGRGIGRPSAVEQKDPLAGLEQRHLEEEEFVPAQPPAERSGTGRIRKTY